MALVDQIEQALDILGFDQGLFMRIWDSYPGPRTRDNDGKLISATLVLPKGQATVAVVAHHPETWQPIDWTLTYPSANYQLRVWHDYSVPNEVTINHEITTIPA